MTTQIDGTTGIQTSKVLGSDTPPTQGDELTRKDYVDGVAIGVGQTWQDMTASRAVATTYTNSTGRPIYVHIDCTNSIGGNGTLLNINGVVSLRSSRAVSADGAVSVAGIIPAGNTYSITAATGGTIALTLWAELR